VRTVEQAKARLLELGQEAAAEHAMRPGMPRGTGAAVAVLAGVWFLKRLLRPKRRLPGATGVKLASAAAVVGALLRVAQPFAPLLMQMVLKKRQQMAARTAAVRELRARQPQ
jgi:hypothetical protein